MNTNQSKGEILYRRPLPIIKESTAPRSPSPPTPAIIEDGITPAPPASREQQKRSFPQLLGTAETSFGEDEIWQWLVTNTEVASSPSVNVTRERTRTKDKRHHSTDLPEQLPQRGMPSLPGRQPRRLRNRRFPDPSENDAEYASALIKKHEQFTLQDFIVKLESNAMIAKPVLEKAILSKNHYQKLLKILHERVEEDAKKNYSNKGLAVFDMNEEFDFPALKQSIKSPRPELESELSNALYEHVRDVDKEQQKIAHQKKQQLEELELPPSLAKMKADQTRRSAWRKKQQEMAADLQNHPLAVFGETMQSNKIGNITIDTLQNTSDSLQFYAQPTHFQDSVRTKEPFSLVNREDEVSPTEFAVLESLFSGGRWLSLKAHFISEVPNLMLLRRTLTYINLSFNCFSEIPHEIYEMENLQILKLRNNPIREIPHECIRLKRLRVLVLSFCMISSISASFWYGMERLILLDLSYNKLASIPNEIMYLKSLRELNLSGNQLIGLPAGALYLNLKQLSIANNYMHPLLWADNAKNSPQRLQDMAAYMMVKQNLLKRYPDLPEPVKQYLQTGFVACDACKGPRFGRGLIAIRPCEFIFGIRGLPFVFNCCSAECVYIFRRGIADPIELRTNNDDDQDPIDDVTTTEMALSDLDKGLVSEHPMHDASPFSPVRRTAVQNESSAPTNNNDL